MKKQSKKHQNAKPIGEKLKTKGLMLFVSLFSCDLQDFFQYVNRKASGTSFLYWVDFKADFGYLAKKVIMKRYSNSFFFKLLQFPFIWLK